MKYLAATLRPAIVSLLAFTALLGIGYPIVVGGVAALVFPVQAHGSLVRDARGTVIGSALVGQPFDDPAYFWSRPSAVGHDAMTSSGTNAGPTGFVDRAGTLGPNPALVAAVQQRVRILRDADPDNRARIPIDLVTASASGLDPHISPAAARYQVGRVARQRGVPVEDIRALVERSIEPRTLGILGEPRVDVLALNRALDQLVGSRIR